MGKTGKIKTGIAGLGRSGWDIHALGLEKLPDLYEVTAVCETNPGRAREAEAKFGCRVHQDFSGLISDREVELVVVATPSHLHTANTIDALESGKDVVCEKPMAINLRDADRMMKASADTGGMLTIFQNRRYAPDFKKIMEVLESGKLGRIVEVKMMWQSFGRRWDWQTLKEFGGGELKNTSPHAIDLALQFFRGAEPEVYCHMERTMTLGDAEDHVKIILKADGCPLLDIEVTRACAYPENKWLIMGTQGGLSGTFTKLRWKHFRPEDLQSRKVERTPTGDRSYNSENIPWQPEEEWEAGEHEDSKMPFYRDLYKTMREGAPLVIKPEDVRKQMFVIDKCQEICPV